MTIIDIPIGKCANITNVNGNGSLRCHLLDMGLVPGTEVQMVKYAPMGDPIEVCLHGYMLTLRIAEAELIEVGAPHAATHDTSKTTDNTAYNTALHNHNAHPGYGESGKYHTQRHANPLPPNTPINIALIGQPNSGKTTLFNQLTGSKRHAGNFPGQTIAADQLPMVGSRDTTVTDLPGICSMMPYNREEAITTNYLLQNRPEVIINVVDACNIERHLYLSMQLMELEIPMVVALNMIDENQANGGGIRVNELERWMGLPVVPISALMGNGVDELMDHVLHVARNQERPERRDVCEKGEAMHRCLHSIMHLIEDHAESAQLPLRYAASKVVEQDQQVLEALHLSHNELEMIGHILVQLTEESGLDSYAAMAKMRYRYIHKLCLSAVVRPQHNKLFKRSQQIDSVLTGRWTAIPIFVVVMSLIVWLSIDVIGAPLQTLLDNGITQVGEWCYAGMTNWGVNETVRSLVVDAIFGGVGSVLSFIPIILLLFFFLSILEDSGYMSRVAFVTDKLLRRLGLSGHSIVPMLIGFGCSVPAVMATQTLHSKQDRLNTLMLIPFMSCSAKIPIYAFIIDSFFPQHGGLVLVTIYLLGIAMGILIAWIMRLCKGRSEVAPFVMEMPNYRMLNIKNMTHLLWDKSKDFVQHAFTVIFVASILIWILRSFNFQFELVSDSSQSILCIVSEWIIPVFEPIGLGSWQLVTALLCGLFAKESVVSTLQVLGGAELLTTVTAIPMMVFCLLYTPCVAAIAAIRREVRTWRTISIVIGQCVVAWVAAWVAFAIAQLIV